VSYYIILEKKTANILTLMKEIVLFVITVVFAYGIHYYWVLLPLTSGYGAKYMCSATFIAGFSEQQQLTEDLNRFPTKYATYTIDYNDLSVSSSVFGFAQRRATVCKKIIWTPFHRFVGTKISERRRNIFLILIIPFDRPESLVYFTRKKNFF